MPSKYRCLETRRKSVPIACKPPNGAVAIPLTKNAVAWVDEEDFSLVSTLVWHAKLCKQSWYALTSSLSNYANRRRISKITYMHQLILPVGNGQEVDHIRHAAWPIVDNRRSNLRACSRAQNTQHVRKSANKKSSIFKGVHLSPRNRKSRQWKATIWLDGRSQEIGGFATEVLAARAYDLRAVQLHNEFALTNFPVPGSKHWMFGPAFPVPQGEGVAK